MAAERPAIGAAASLSSLVITPLGEPSSVVVLVVLTVVLVVLTVVRNGRTGDLTLSVVVVLLDLTVVVVVGDAAVVVVVICCLVCRAPTVPSVTGLTKSSKFI